SRRQRKHPHLQVFEIEDDGDAGVGQTGTMIELLIGDFGQDELRSHHFAVDQLFANAFQDGFQEQAHRLIRARAQRHEFRTLAEMVEEELPDLAEVLLDLHLFLQIFEFSQIQSQNSSSENNHEETKGAKEV